jgi:hypothetical protein
MEDRYSRVVFDKHYLTSTILYEHADLEPTSDERISSIILDYAFAKLAKSVL